MIHLTYFFRWLLRHGGRLAGMPEGNNKFYPCHHQAVSRAKWSTASCPLLSWIVPTGAHPVGFPQGTQCPGGLLPPWGWGPGMGGERPQR